MFIVRYFPHHLPQGNHPFLSACRKEVEATSPLPPTGPYRLEGTALAYRLAAGRDQAGLRSPKAGGSDRNRNVLEPETSPGRTTENTTESPPRTRGTRSIRKQLALLSMKSESESPQECVVSEAAFEAAGAHLARTLCFGL